MQKNLKKILKIYLVLTLTVSLGVATGSSDNLVGDNVGFYANSFNVDLQNQSDVSVEKQTSGKEHQDFSENLVNEEYLNLKVDFLDLKDQGTADQGFVHKTLEGVTLTKLRFVVEKNDFELEDFSLEIFGIETEKIKNINLYQEGTLVSEGKIKDQKVAFSRVNTDSNDGFVDLVLKIRFADGVRSGTRMRLGLMGVEDLQIDLEGKDKDLKMLGPVHSKYWTIAGTRSY